MTNSLKTKKRSFLNEALKFHESGLKIIPVNDDKSPACNNWKGFQESQTVSEVIEIFKKDCYGIALIMCDGLEAIDIDLKYQVKEGLFNKYVEAIELFECKDSISITEDICIQSTQNKGFHFIYRCSETSGNQKLASRPATENELKEFNEKQTAKKATTISDRYKLPKVLLETRGKGGYILIDPSPGYAIDNGTLSDIPEITPLQRKVLLLSAKLFDEMFSTNLAPIETQTVPRSINSKNVMPLDAFKEEGDTVGILTSGGWEVVHQTQERVFLRRPGKDRGISADYHKRLRLFKCFSTSTQFESEKAYSAVGVYAVINHNGDIKATAKDLYHQGYGTRMESVKEQSEILIDGENEEGDFEDMYKNAISNKFDISQRIVNPAPVLEYIADGRAYFVGSFGMLGIVKGREKSRKSKVLSIINASAIKAAPIMGFSLDFSGREILHIDTEQSQYYYDLSQRSIYQYAKRSTNEPRYNSFLWRGFDVEDYFELIDTYLHRNPKTGILQIDGVMDLCNNFNDEKQAKDAVNMLCYFRDQYNLLVIGVMHKSRGHHSDTIGHLGAFINRKADFAIDVEKNEMTGYSNVSSKGSRGAYFPSFQFTQDDNGIPQIENDHLNILEHL